ncbi:MAG TPA: hypothetical protein ENK40_04460 [Gammaproteobacteria bacterium]|nr:hypothetical protein [Gammaproteobacteria bacterium]
MSGACGGISAAGSNTGCACPRRSRRWRHRSHRVRRCAGWTA